MTRRSIILVSCGVLAVLVGVAVAVIGSRDSTSSAAAATAPVLVAGEAIIVGTAGGTAGESGMVSVHQVAVGERQLGALTDPAQLIGRTFAVEVAPGEQVMLTDLDAPALRDASIEVPAGTEAVAIEVPFVPGGAGYAAPGDSVNVFALLDSVDPALLAPAADPAAATATGAAATSATVSVLTNVVVLDVSVEVAPRVAARTDAVAASSSTSTTAPSGATAAAPSQITYLLAVPVADVADLVQAVGFHRLYVSIPAEGTAPRPATSTDDAELIGAGR